MPMPAEHARFAYAEQVHPLAACRIEHQRPKPDVLRLRNPKPLVVRDRGSHEVFYLICGSLQRGRIGDIAGDAAYLRLAIIPSEFSDGRRYGVGRSTADRHRASTFQELAGEPVADASRRSGDYNPLAHLSPFSGAPIERSSLR